MATKDDFTGEEWETLRRGVTGAGLLVSLSDRGFFDSFKEAGALARHLAEAQKGSSSELVRELASERGTGFGLTDRPDEIERETTGALRSAAEVLGRKAPDELDAYRQLVLDMAGSVGQAAGGGEDAEREAVAKIEAALGGASA